MPKTVRFKQNFVLSIVETKLNDAGEMVPTETILHVAFGDIYTVDRWEINGNNVTIFFPDDPALSRIHGIAPQVDLGACEFKDTEQLVAAAEAASRGGCGCGNH